jgi:hypothetical protein
MRDLAASHSDPALLEQKASSAGSAMRKGIFVSIFMKMSRAFMRARTKSPSTSR